MLFGIEGKEWVIATLEIENGSVRTPWRISHSSRELSLFKLLFNPQLALLLLITLFFSVILKKEHHVAGW